MYKYYYIYIHFIILNLILIVLTIIAPDCETKLIKELTSLYKLLLSSLSFLISWIIKGLKDLRYYNIENINKFFEEQVPWLQ